jgi:hypothetical protein
MSRTLALAVAAALTACDAPAPAAKTETPHASAPAPVPEVPRAVAMQVYSVDSISFEIAKSLPIQLTIKARGTVRTGGWSDGELRPLETAAPEVGVRSFVFYAAAPRPDMMVTQALSPIEATFTIPALPADVKAIRILAETNEMTQALP